MLLRFTDKLSKKLKTGPLTKVDRDPGPYFEWYANFFTADRTQYILTTEAKSLFSVVMYGRGITNDGVYLKHLTNLLSEYMAETENRLIFERVIAPKIGAVTMSKTSNRSVLGSMNDMVNMSQICIAYQEASTLDLMTLINRTPFKAINYKSPAEAFRKMKLT